MYSKGWKNYMKDSSVHEEVIEYIKERLEGYVPNATEFKHTILGEDEEYNIKGRRK